MGLCTFYIASIAFLTPAPTAFANIKWKYFLVFLCCSIVVVILTYFYVPEASYSVIYVP